jgi:uncharacterized protein DUF6461
MIEQSSYEWAESDWQSLGCCIAVAEGISADEALRRLVTLPATEFDSPAVVRRWAEGPRLPDYATSVEATTLEGWAVLIEANGYQATLAEPLGRLTAGTRGGVVYWSVNADMSFIWSVEGSIVRHFDPLLFDNHNWWDKPYPKKPASHLDCPTLGHQP